MKLIRQVLLTAALADSLGFSKEAAVLDVIAGKLHKAAQPVDVRQVFYEFESAVQSLSDYIENDKGNELGAVVPTALLAKTLQAGRILRDSIPQGDKWASFRAYISDLYEYVMRMEGQKLKDLEPAVAYVLQNLGPLKRALATLVPAPVEEVEPA